VSIRRWRVSREAQASFLFRRIVLCSPEAKSKRDYLAQGFRRELIACFVRFREMACSRDWMSPPTDAASESPKEEFILDASGHEKPAGPIHLVLTLRGRHNRYLPLERKPDA